MRIESGAGLIISLLLCFDLIAGIEEPKYGRPPKVDRLKDVFGEKESRYY